MTLMPYPPPRQRSSRVLAWFDHARHVLGRRSFYTVLILPHSKTRFRKLHLSRGFVHTLTVLTGFLILAALSSPHLWMRLETQSMLVEKLHRENEALRIEREQFEVAVGELAERLDNFEARAGRLAQELKLKELPSNRAAAGGAIDASPSAPRRLWFDDELRSLNSRTEVLDRSFAVLNDAFDERARRLASTPNMMPVQGWFSHTYGWRKDPFTGQREFHRGVDIVAPTGTEVRAPADAIVTRAGRLTDYGKCIDLSHGHGVSTRFGHLSEVLVHPGQKLRRGDLIGKVGSTGRSTGPHLHYELIRNGRQVNPWSYLGQKGS